MARTDIKVCGGMRKDGTCGNGYNDENHNKPCVGKHCPHRFGEYVERNKRGSIIGGGYIQPGHVRPSVTAMPVPATDYRTLVSEQYQMVCAKTGEFFREVVKFGALLNEVEGFIGESRGGSHDGEGLKGWLEENCPEINYKTAQGYKSMAAKCAKMIGGGTQAIACLQGRDEVIEPASRQAVEVEASFIEKRDALFEQVESRRQLEQMWFQFMGAQRKPGRPAGTQAEYKRRSSLEIAIDAVWPTVQHLLKHRGEMFTAYKLLPDDKLIEMRDTLNEHVGAIAAVLGDRGGVGGSGKFSPVKF